MTLTSSITSAVVALIVVVVVIGAILGLALSGTDLLNPKTSAAEQYRMDAQTDHQNRMNSLEEEKQAKKDKIEIDYFERKAKRSLELLSVREYTLTAAAAFALVMVAFGATFFLIRLGHRWSEVAQQAAHLNASQNKDVWKSRAYHDVRIQMARANEWYLREMFSPAPTTQAPSASD
jgi:predicted PurR-regulated permease PerM